MRKVSRNDSCPCGSGKKYKKCCLGKDDETKSCYSPEQLKGEQRIIKIFNIYMQIVSFFECSKCGKCCSFSSPDLLHSDEYKNFDKDLLFWEDGLPGLKNPCPFFVDNTCKIHDNNIRPRICRVVPFSFPDDPEYPHIIIEQCELGNKILDAYFIFLEETNTGDNDILCDLMYPLSNIQRAKAFLKWLKKNENSMRSAKTMECARPIQETDAPDSGGSL